MATTTRRLLYASRGLALCAVLAGIGMGAFYTLFAGLVCFDNCPTADLYYSTIGRVMLHVLTPCVTVEAAALATFLVYCALARRPRRAASALLVLTAGALLGGAVIGELLSLAPSVLTVTSDLQIEGGALVTWTRLLGAAIAVVTGLWSSLLVHLQWARE